MVQAKTLHGFGISILQRGKDTANVSESDRTVTTSTEGKKTEVPTERKMLTSKKRRNPLALASLTKTAPI